MNRHCKNFVADERIDPTRCEIFSDPTECEYFTDVMPVHDDCGLPVELCNCKDARVKFIDGKFIDTKPPTKDDIAGWIY